MASNVHPCNIHGHVLDAYCANYEQCCWVNFQECDKHGANEIATVEIIHPWLGILNRTAGDISQTDGNSD